MKAKPDQTARIESVRPGDCYEAGDGSQRLVWAVRNGAVCFFSRPAPDAAWSAGHPAQDPPPIEQFISEIVSPVGETALAANLPPDRYGDGEW